MLSKYVQGLIILHSAMVFVLAIFYYNTQTNVNISCISYAGDSRGHWPSNKFYYVVL